MDRDIYSKIIAKIKDIGNKINAIPTDTTKISSMTITTDNSDIIAVTSLGITPENFINAVVTGTNNVFVVPYMYGQTLYLFCVDTDLKPKGNGDYTIIIKYIDSAGG